MGIPSYFSYILRKHKHILKRHFIKCDALYLDANSIIYDNLNKEGLIYANVYDAIQVIIQKFKPATTFICFDGVAPMAKMVQQKQRRYKSHFTNALLGTTSNSNALTPGTIFMNELNVYLRKQFKDDHTVTLSGTDEPGEGEYKIFKYIREQKEPDTFTRVIYGLDADLIMLSLLHLPADLYLYRETKHFAYLGTINEAYDYVLDVKLLGKQITELAPIRDYCFLCFLCGNDFLPHFPSINIRNGGIEHLLDHYKRAGVRLVEESIVWPELYKLFHSLAKDEQAMIEKQIRWKPTRKAVTITHADRLNSLPLYDRDEEDYLLEYPNQYNMILFKQSNDDALCKKYLEMLEWTWNYYTGLVVDLYTYYPMHYAPRFKSLLGHFPLYGESFMPIVKNTTFVHPITQLLYVLPYADYGLIPRDVSDIVKAFPALATLHYNIQYAFCMFFWEAHVDIGFIPIVELDHFVNK